MVFSSTVFLYLFLPIVLALYYFAHPSLRNVLLLLASLFFYAWGEVRFAAVMMASIAMNYGVGLLINRSADSQRLRKLTLGLGVTLNLALLVYFKYADFLVASLNGFLARFDGPQFAAPNVHLPIGISFFTFQAMSYIFDVYRRETEVQRNPIHMGMYIALFPQLIAGPIVRYHDIAAQLRQRSVTLAKFSSGIRRFIIGLAKKLLIANPVGYVADQVFAIAPDELSTPVAWFGVLCYTLQIYFDFSGYSDMAVGLGRMFGFEFLENFRWPYISQSIQEFWRRWHISLSNWFRDYLYIPLGGNRKGVGRTYVNLVLVFFLCGLWHGASWMFVIWGLYHGLFLVLERTRFSDFLDFFPRIIRHAYVVLTVMIGWVFFRAESLEQAGAFLRSMAGFGSVSGMYNVGMYWTPELAIVLTLGIVGSTPIVRWTVDRFAANQTAQAGAGVASMRFACTFATHAVLIVLYIACGMSVATSTHNPFIYFRF